MRLYEAEKLQLARSVCSRLRRKSTHIRLPGYFGDIFDSFPFVLFAFSSFLFFRDTFEVQAHASSPCGLHETIQSQQPDGNAQVRRFTVDLVVRRLEIRLEE